MNLHADTVQPDHGPLWADTRHEWAARVLADLSDPPTANATPSDRAVGGVSVLSLRAPAAWARPTPGLSPAAGAPDLRREHIDKWIAGLPTTRTEVGSDCDLEPGLTRAERVSESLESAGEAGLPGLLGKRSDFAAQDGNRDHVTSRKRLDSLRRTSARWAADRRVAACGQAPAFRKLKGGEKGEGAQRLPAVTVRVNKAGHAKWGGVYRCAAGWVCPCCAPVITEQRRGELIEALTAHRAAGGGASLVTFTVPHGRHDKLAELVVAVQAAFREITGGRQGIASGEGPRDLAEWKRDRRRRAQRAKYLRGKLAGAKPKGRSRLTPSEWCWLRDHVTDGGRKLFPVRGMSGRRLARLKELSGWIGQVRALEVTHGRNGWHPHLHVLWLARPMGNAQRELLRMALLDLWREACASVGLGEPDPVHGVDVRGGDHAAEYVSKFGWGLAEELSKANHKQGRQGSVNPWGLLAAAHEGDPDAQYRWGEWGKAMKGRAALTWSKGLRKKLGLGDELTDEEVAEKEDERGEIVARVQAERDPGDPLRLSDWEVLALWRKQNDALEIVEKAHGSRGDPQERLDELIRRLRIATG